MKPRLQKIVTRSDRGFSKYPKALKIGAHLYELVIEKPGVLQPELYGQTDRKNNRISIDGSMPARQIGATLIHEVLHAINNELNHTVLDSLAEQLFQVLADNNLIK